MAEKIYISVIVPLRLNWIPCYSIPPGTEGSVAPGTRVKVRFGMGVYVGVVNEIGVKPDIDSSRILPVLSVENLAPVSGQELGLWKFVADYYLCSVGEVYQAAYPNFRVKGEQALVRREIREGERIAKRLASLESRLEGLESKISRKREQISRLKPSSKVFDRDKLLYEGQLQGYIEQSLKVQSEIDALRFGELPAGGCEFRNSASDGSPVLSEAQSKAKEEIAGAFSKNKIALLNGITGSGKTEIYVTFALQTLARGKSVLYMVPEIAMTCQLECRLRKFFGDSLLVCSSSISPSGRLQVAESLRNGPHVLLGTRSSIFLPFVSLGLVVVDEEHDTSFKQDSVAPRYNGRDCAVVLGHLHGADVLLGSATPSFESLYNCLSGRYVEVRLDKRYYGDEDSRLEIIDTCAERRKRGMVGSLSRKLISHIHDTLEAGEQVLVLRGRRAYSPLVQCEECGDIPKCPHCNVPLSFHKDRNALICHYCGYHEGFAIQCPKCKKNRVFVGSGTQRVEEEISALFPNARVARLDGDVHGDAASVVKDFEEGRTDILVGTQIVSKGFDFARLSLVAVVQSDTLLGLEDFRADERAFQLLSQLRGRGGRRGRSSLFVVQTSQPLHPVYSKLSDGQSFVHDELLVRKTFSYPPFVRLVCVTLRGRNSAVTESESQEVALALAHRLGVGLSVPGLGNSQSAAVSRPCPPVIEKQADEYIRNIRISLPRDASLAGKKALVMAVVGGFEARRGFKSRIVVDVDPI